jgi:phage tail-like protein
MAVGQRKDPYLSFRFLLEIDTLIRGGFSDVSGLQAEVDAEEYHEGGINNYVHQLPTVTKYPNLILKRGITDSDVLWKWQQDVVNGNIQRKNGRIVILDAQGDEALGWEFEAAYPIRWLGPEFQADRSAVAIETIELVHQGIKKT